MVTLITKKRDFKFNLKTTGFRGEIALCQTITKLQSEKPRSKINITTDEENLSIKISDIIDILFSESEFVKCTVK